MSLESFMVRRISRHYLNAQTLLFRGEYRLAQAARARAHKAYTTLCLMRAWKIV